MDVGSVTARKSTGLSAHGPFSANYEPDIVEAAFGIIRSQLGRLVLRWSADSTKFGDSLNICIVAQSSIWFPMVWIGGVIAASILYRTKVGKPIQPKIAPDALYAESKAGGPWASNCLLVSVTASELTVEPAFPFNLMFLPEIWGTEYRIPISEIKSAEVFQGWLMNTKIGLKSGQTITLKLNRPNTFLRALKIALGHSES